MSTYRCIVFDLDGTLYDQRALRLRMGLRLLAHALSGPRGLRDTRVLATFRRVREHLAEEGAREVARLQFARTAEVTGATEDSVRRLVEDWMEQRPLVEMPKVAYQSARPIMEKLRGRRIATAVWSDYPARGKLDALRVDVDIVVSSEDFGIGVLKPDPAGLRHVASLADVDPRECLLVGDRDDRDGAAARRCGAGFLLLRRGLDRDGTRTLRSRLDL